jgi:hypothetical protein
MPAAQHMQMHVADRLPTVCPCIGDDAETSRQCLPGNRRRGFQQVPQQRIAGLGHVGEVLLRNRQQVRRRLRIDIGEDEAEVVFKDGLHRNLMRGDLAEEAIGHAPNHNPELLLEELRLLTRRPRIIMFRERRAEGNRRMRIGPELEERIRLRFDQVGLTQ